MGVKMKFTINEIICLQRMTFYIKGEFDTHNKKEVSELLSTVLDEIDLIVEEQKALQNMNEQDDDHSDDTSSRKNGVKYGTDRTH